MCVGTQQGIALHVRGCAGQQVPQQLLHKLNQRQALLPSRLVDACVNEVLVQHGATAVHGGSVGLLFINLLLFLRLLLGFDVLQRKQKIVFFLNTIFKYYAQIAENVRGDANNALSI